MAATIEQLKQKFIRVFGAGEIYGVYFAPGRVNLIGDHTDYNGGHVLPCALTLGTYAAVRKRRDGKIRFCSLNFGENVILEFSQDDLAFSAKAGWTNYPRGILWTLQKRGYRFPGGMDVLYYGDVPSGAGLSSSASLEVATGWMINDLFHFGLSLTDIAVLGQESEKNYNGVNCGIMDQFVSAMGKRNRAIFLDTDTLDYEYVPARSSSAKLVLANSGVKHSLVDSAYNDRRRECREAFSDIRKMIDIQSLCDLTAAQFEATKQLIKDPVCKKRARHAVYENERTVLATEALKKNDLKTFGKLMNESHVSLRDDYETSCAETDLLAELAWRQPGVFGSRITGGGFGGCTVSLVKEEAVENFIREVGDAYRRESGIVPEFYIAECGEGARRLE